RLVTWNKSNGGGPNILTPISELARRPPVFTSMTLTRATVVTLITNGYAPNTARSKVRYGSIVRPVAGITTSPRRPVTATTASPPTVLTVNTTVTRYSRQACTRRAVAIRG